MDISLKIFAFIVILCYFIIVLGFLRKKKFDLKYSLLWLLAGIIMILVVAFPNFIIWVTGMMGVKGCFKWDFCNLYFVRNCYYDFYDCGII